LERHANGDLNIRSNFDRAWACENDKIMASQAFFCIDPCQSIATRGPLGGEGGICDVLAQAKLARKKVSKNTE
jgi:hypothetical protein